MGYLAYVFFTCLAFFTIRISEDDSCEYYTGITAKTQTTSGCHYTSCPTCPYGHYNYRYDWRGCQECYCEWTSIITSAITRCPYAMCPTCDYNHYATYRTDWRGCQECYCEWMNTTPPPPYVGATDSSFQPHPASYWSMSRSSLLSILLNMKQEAQSLIDNAKNTYDHILHSVIVNDVRKRREAAREEENKDQVDNKQA